jgi:hypothetical protein
MFTISLYGIVNVTADSQILSKGYRSTASVLTKLKISSIQYESRTHEMFLFFAGKRQIMTESTKYLTSFKTQSQTIEIRKLVSNTKYEETNVQST